ncbi:MAG: phosphate signaling complex protein PhoU [Halodesulfurarchaeum sp.]|nr:phosphate signaling complex protein PhoU [Halodesulfurarchaeum sp.]
MPRETFQEALEELRTDVQQLGELVLERLDRSLSALETADRATAKRVIEGDEEINRRYLALESRCIDLFALQQPVAGDLRFVAASFKILTDVERIGDLARNLAQYSLTADQETISDVAIPDIGAAARDLVADALDAYGTEDTALCHQVADRDDQIDALCHRASERVVRDLIEREASPWSVEQVLDDVSIALLIIRDLERVADHGVNIAARTLYLLENDSELLY